MKTLTGWRFPFLFTIPFSSSIGLQRKCSQLKRLRDKLREQFRVWVCTRKRTRRLLKLFKKELSSLRERLPRDLSTRRRTEQREAPGWFILSVISGVAIVFYATGTAPAPALVVGVAGAVNADSVVARTVGVAAVAAVATVAAVAACFAREAVVMAAAAGDAEVDAAREETTLKRWKRKKIARVREAIDEEKNACQRLERIQNLLGNCVADFAVFCRDRIDLVLSTKLEGEFRILLSILRGTRSPGAAANSRVSLPVLLDEEVNIHGTHVNSLMEQLWRSTASQEMSSTITQQILDELREGPNAEEIWTMIMNFIEAKFAEACKT